MNLQAGLETFLYIVSSTLFFPDLLALTFLIFWMFVSCGAFLREYLVRRRGVSYALTQYRRALEEMSKETLPANLDLEAERLLQKAELACVRVLDRVRFAVRVGPALGLMGTLIPMGISLSALAQGDMPKMAGTMVTAFTATVAGLACSVVAYLISMQREKWVRADLREMEYFTELTLRKAGQNEAVMTNGMEVTEDAIS